MRVCIIWSTEREFVATQYDTIFAVIYSLTLPANSINTMQLCVSRTAASRGVKWTVVNMYAKARELKVCAFWLIGRHATRVYPCVDFDQGECATRCTVASDVYFHRAWITADKFAKEILLRACALFSRNFYLFAAERTLGWASLYHKCCAMNFVRGGQRAFLPAFQDKIARTIWRGYAFTITVASRIAYVNAVHRARVSNWTVGFFFIHD